MRMSMPASYAASLLCFALLALSSLDAAAGGRSKAMKALSTVSIEVLPARPASLMTRGKASAGMAGIVGVLVAREMAARPNEMSALIEKEGIHPESVVADALRAQLVERNILQISDAPADAVMRIDTAPAVMPAEDGKYRIMLAVTVSFVRGDGKVIWTQQDFSGDAVPPAMLEAELLAKPDLVREHLAIAAAQVAKILASRIYVSRL
jgi:hypothetical protein